MEYLAMISLALISMAIGISIILGNAELLKEIDDDMSEPKWR